MPDPRQRLLDAAIDHLAAHGLSDLSLRQLAAALGTSHRMLIYHFGSKEGLLVEAIRAVERRQRDAFAEVSVENAASPGDVLRRMWQRFADPALAPHERLFFEVYGQALQGRPHAVPLLDGIVESWLEPAVEYARRHGVPEDVARADARLGVAVMRGLLLDLLATGDREGVDAALERFVEAYETVR
ncbi:TetR/AcrR family transcriptional regulator [Phytohabitans rumicis]|uniref:TetR family transcriptional regulator n=1 Tax=Phytohabitans rumicis TaxID=1076125 RepID=A0A6V8KZS1_9ACTN|nr:TetR/AcrR family transcriptional regulator [Phytohabitans rumicis]GFJ88208.1 TetR family transcriptional regulator [Phytohabitans rumicis]